MSNIEVHAGDFLPVKHHKYNNTNGEFKLLTQKHWFKGEKLKTTDIVEINIASEENVKKIGGTLGWGAAGAVVLGPVGLLAGLLLGGKKNQVTFVAKFKDGRKMLATTDSKTYTKITAQIF